MACVKFLLLALAYMCSNEVKQRCILRLFKPNEHHDSERYHEHRIWGILWLRELNEHRHPGRCHEHRVAGVR